MVGARRLIKTFSRRDRDWNVRVYQNQSPLKYEKFIGPRYSLRTSEIVIIMKVVKVDSTV